MNLADRKRFKNEAIDCIMCGHYIEDLKHFLLHYPAYSQERRKIPTLQQPYQENEHLLIGSILYTNHTAEENKRMLYRFWQTRNNRIKKLTS